MAKSLDLFNLPARFDAGEYKYQFIYQHNGWFMYRVSMLRNIYHTVRFEVFTPDDCGLCRPVKDTHYIHQGYPPEEAFEKRENAYRFDTLRDAVDFLESC